jgi:radical SAM superfamily enzyme YgiQ (UPF0313 family)
MFRKEKMHVILIYPEFPTTFWSFKYALKFVNKKASSPPLGLLTMAALLPKTWQKVLVDMNISRLTQKDLEWADLVFISGMTLQRESARQVISRCKQAGLKVVAGGPLFTLEHEKFKSVDHFVLNEAEVTLPKFLKDLQAGKARRIYQTAEFADIRKSPAPLWELLEMKKYAAMSIQYSRGCPFNCDFCNVTSLFGHLPRTKNAAQILSELDALYQAGWREGVFFVDDNLIGNKKALKNELLPALIQWRKGKRGISFNTQVSINLADDTALIHQMVEAGFNMVFVGIETPEENSLAECSKKQNLNRDLVADVKRLQRAGLQVQGGFIVGFDHDTSSTFYKLINFIQESGIVTAMVGLLQAPIGTKLYERLSRAGRILKRVTGDNTDGSTNVVPIMDAKLLRKGYKKLMSTLYSPRVYYQRVKTFLSNYQPPKMNLHLDFQYIFENLRAFLRSIVLLGILGKERKEYWKLFFWSLLHRPSVFPLAIVFSIYGYHFRKISELIQNYK